MNLYKYDGTLLDDSPQGEGIRTDRVLIWNEEFDGTEVDPSKWSHYIGIYGNRYYMYQDVGKNAYVEDSVLHLTCLRDFPNGQDGIEFSGAFIHTNEKFEFRYGRVEAKIKFPTATEYHGTLWTLGSNYWRINNETLDETQGVPWPYCGEIDIAEADDGSVTHTVHWGTVMEDQEGHESGGIGSYGVTASNWHVYAVEWTETAMTFYVDGVSKGSFSISNADVNGYNAFNLPHFLMLNLNPYLNATASAQSEDFLEIQVDWIRVYAPEGATEIVKETAITLDESSVSMQVGEEHLLTCSFTPVTVINRTLVWDSYDDSVVTCYGGKLTAIAAGTTYVRCRSKNGFAAYCKVVVA